MGTGGWDSLDNTRADTLNGDTARFSRDYLCSPQGRLLIGKFEHNHVPSPEKAVGFEMQTMKSGGFRSTVAPVGRESLATILRRPAVDDEQRSN